jgi:hypothetical protein
MMKKSLFNLLILLLISSIPVFSQSKSTLKKHSLVRLILSVRPGSLIIPGASVPVGVTAIVNEGKDLNTTGWLGGKLKWKNFIVETSHGEFKNGLLNVSDNLNPLKDTVITLTIKSKFHPDKEVSQLIRLNHLKEIELFTNLSYSSDISPGTSFPIDLVGLYDNGTETSTSGESEYSNKLKGYDIKVNGGYFSNNRIHINENYRQIPNHKVKIIVASRIYKGIRDTLEVKLNYKRNYEVHFRGASGQNGSTFYNYGPVARSHSNCFHGGNGERGYDGQDLKIYISSYYDSILFQKILKVSVREAYSTGYKEFLINPFGGSIRVISEGGDGGNGANGSDGPPGSNGTDGAVKVKKEKINDSTTVEREVRDPGGNGGPGGPGGNGGTGGHGGDGGRIKVYYTKTAEPFLDAIIPISIGGGGGIGGFGGNGGPGGRGGKGEPYGSDGISGIGGSNGFQGYSGSEGQVVFREMNQLDSRDFENN